MASYSYKSRRKSAATKIQRRWRKSRRRKPTISNRTLKTKAIDSQVEKTIVRIHNQLDQAETWQTSRVEHFASGKTFPSSHARPAFNDMVELQANTIWFHDLTQLPTDSTDNLQESKVGKYQIKTIQSRLRFYSKNMEAENDDCPICVRAVLLKINNSGRKGVLTGGSNINVDIWPDALMIPDTNLQFSGIHKKDLIKTPSSQGVKGTVIAQKKFWIYPNKATNGGRDDGANSANSSASNVKTIILTKTYKKPLVHYQTVQDTSVDDILSQAQNKAKIIGDRVWLCVLSDAQLNFAFYGVSGCIYNYSEIEGLPSVPLPEAQEIIGGQNN